MKIDEINKLTDTQLDEQKLYYENRKAGFKEYYDEYTILIRKYNNGQVRKMLVNVVSTNMRMFISVCVTLTWHC